MYVAALNSTAIADVSRMLSGRFERSAIANISEEGGLANPRNIQLSHQADVTPDGRILLITDERGGGLQETSCNTDASGVIGGIHFWALKPIAGLPGTQKASPSSPKKISSYFNPNPCWGPIPCSRSWTCCPGRSGLAPSTSCASAATDPRRLGPPPRARRRFSAGQPPAGYSLVWRGDLVRGLLCPAVERRWHR